MIDLVDFDIIGKVISGNLFKGLNILLYGDLGTGKTTLTQFIIKNKLIKYKNIVSPTFAIVKQYDLREYIIYHADLYRLQDPEEIELIDLFYDLNGIYIIEWADFLEHLKPKNNLSININYNKNIKYRDLIIEYNGEKHKTIYDKIQKLY